MGPLGGLLVGTGVGLVGDAINTGVQAHEASLNRKFNAEQASLQRDFEERMSSTAYQRAVDDMRAAGINPQVAMAASQGMASTPQGSSAQTNAQVGRGDSGMSNYRAVLNAQTNARVKLEDRIAQVRNQDDWRDFHRERLQAEISARDLDRVSREATSLSRENFANDRFMQDLNYRRERDSRVHTRTRSYYGPNDRDYREVYD